ncbi:hypothetical protein ACWDAO_19960 [Streptomyces sp. NPDC001212]
MKWLILGALIGALLTIPQALPLIPAVVLAVVTALASTPLFVAFVLGAVARPILTRRFSA